MKLDRLFLGIFISNRPH